MDDNPFAESIQRQGEIENVNYRNRSNPARNQLDDVLYVHPNDHVNLQLVSTPLTGNNYYTWSRAIKRALGARNKLDFINGNLVEPASDSYFHKSWLKADYLVSMWIMNAMSKELAHAFQYIDDSKTLWNEIQNRFDRSSGPKFYQLEHDLCRCVQNNLSVMEYFNNLNSVWDEINILNNPTACTCVVCNCGAAQVAKNVEEKRKVIQFLLGLNDSFDTVRSQILLLDPLPHVSRVYSMVLQDEDQRKATSQNSYAHEFVMLASGSGFNANQKFQRSAGGFKLRLTKEEKRKLNSGYCGENGHEMNDCFKLHGYHNGFEKYKEQKNKDQDLCVQESSSHGAGVFDPGMKQIIRSEIEKSFLKFNQMPKVDDKIEKINMINENKDPLSAYSGHYAFGIAEEVSRQNWILDSGASIHICCNEAFLHSVEKLDEAQKVYLPDGSRQMIKFAGKVQITSQLMLDRVLLAPSFTHNLISVAQLAKDLNVRCTFLDTHCLIQGISGDCIIGMAKAQGKLYVMNSNGHSYANNIATATDMNAYDWHCKLGHVSFTAMQHIPSIRKVCTDEMRKVIEACEICHQAKQCRNPFPLNQRRSDHIFDMIHLDVWGPYHGDNVTNTPFVLTIVDDHSRATWTFLMASKLQVFGILKDFLMMVETQFGVNVKQVRSDNGSEFLNKRVTNLFADKGIIHQRSSVDSPQQKGVVERKHRTLLHVARAVMFNNKLPPRTKFDSRSTKCVLLGVATEHKGFILYDIHGEHVFISRDVKFFEKIFPFASPICDDSFVVLDNNDLNHGATFPHHYPVCFDYGNSAGDNSDVEFSNSNDTSGRGVSLPHPFHTETESALDNSTAAGTDCSLETEQAIQEGECIALRKGKRQLRPPSWTQDFVATCSDHFPSTSSALHTLTCDTSAAIQITKNVVFHENTKHIDLDCHHVCGLFASGPRFSSAVVQDGPC